MTDDCLATTYRNAIGEHFGRRDFTAEDLAGLDYREVARLPKIGKQGLRAIRAWLWRQGLDLRKVPVSDRRVPARKAGVERAIRLLERRGYQVIPPAAADELNRVRSETPAS